MDQPIDIHFTKLDEWLTDRRAVLAKSHAKEYDACVKAAPRLLQLVKYDIPAVRKQFQKLNSQIDESSKVISGTEKNKQGWAKKRVVLLESLGIASKDNHCADDASSSSVLVMSDELDARIEVAAHEYSQNVKKKLSQAYPLLDEMYHAHVSSLQQPSTGSIRWSARHFPWLQRLFDECDVDDSDASISAKKAQHEGDAAVDAPSIQWDDEPTISWDDDAPIEVLSALAEVDHRHDTTLAAECFGPPSAVAGGVSVQLTRPEHRSAVTEELHAATVFVKERIIDLAGLNTSAAATFSPKELVALRALDGVRDAITFPQHVDLLRMRSNFRQKERFLQSLETIQRGLSLVTQRSMEHELRLATASDDAAKCLAELTSLLDEGRKLQQQTEVSLTKIFAPRPVSIVGEINKILQ